MDRNRRSGADCRRPRARGPALTALALLVACCSCSGDDPPARRPSVILVSIDTLRADHVGLYGYDRDTTPFLDRWADQGLVFERAFTTAAWTLVAHMTMLTGLFPEQHGVIGKRRALSSEIPLLAERLHAAGYRTFSLHSPGWIEKRYGFERGFELFRPHESLEEADEHFNALLPELRSDEPFFLFLHVFDVHCSDLEKSKTPYTAPQPFESMFVGNLPPLPDMPLEKLWHSRNLLTPEQIETLVALYDGGIRQVDDQLERWFAELERRGLSQGALVIVTADHGEALGQRGKLDMHGECWQEGLHVPLIVRHPDGLRAGERVSVPVHLGDLVPTILAACGLPGDERLPGHSLFGVLPPERVIYGVKLPEAFVLRWPEKLVLGPKDSILAMDLARDPAELAPEKGDRARFEALRQEALAPGLPFPEALKLGELSAEEKAKLEALGYGGEDKDEPDEEDAKKSPPSSGGKKPSNPPSTPPARPK